MPPPPQRQYLRVSDQHIATADHQRYSRVEELEDSTNPNPSSCPPTHLIVSTTSDAKSSGQSRPLYSRIIQQTTKQNSRPT